MKAEYKIALFAGIVPLFVLVGGCQFNGEPLFEDSKQSFNFGGSVNDDAPLSENVRQALRQNPETTTLRLDISEVSEGTVKITGIVDNEAIRAQIERVAGQVEGVKFVVNSLFIVN